jgi:putative FmdB family regulatory protein
MPIYEYQCTDCEHEFETIQKISEDLLVTCPNCSKDSLRKKISAAGFRLKGGGWYETDFKSGGRKNVSGDDKGGSKSDGAKSDGAKSDSSSSSSSGSSDSSSSSSTSSKSEKSAKSNSSE